MLRVMVFDLAVCASPTAHGASDCTPCTLRSMELLPSAFLLLLCAWAAAWYGTDRTPVPCLPAALPFAPHDYLLYLETTPEFRAPCNMAMPYRALHHGISL